MPHSLSHANALPAEEFVRLAGPAFEHSPWVAERVAAARPFGDVGELHGAMCAVVRTASDAEKLALIRAHPDLVGRAVLTSESSGEQASAGLADLSPDEVALFDRSNREYQTRFGFPFVICARRNKKDAILRAFPLRLRNAPDAEINTALEEIFKIAALRLTDLFA